MKRLPLQPRAHLADRIADTALGVLATLHALVAASLLFVLLSLSPASAAEPPACTGKNLLPDLQASDPAAYAQLVGEAKTETNGEGIFWKIEKPGTSPSYLLGTMHVTDPRVVAMPDAAQAAYEEAQTVVVESDEIADVRKASATILTRPDLTMFTDGRTIPGLLGEKDAAILAEGLKARGLSLTAVARMKPWMIMSFVALPACEMARKQAGLAFLDQKLAQDALADGKTLKGLETMIEQISALDGLPLEPQLAGLLQVVQLGDGVKDVIETMSQLYLSGQTGMIMPLMRMPPPGVESDDNAYADFEQRIIIDRNHRMAERAAPILAEGNVFIAVGALHLPGKEGVVELLRAQGFTLTPVR